MDNNSPGSVDISFAENTGLVIKLNDLTVKISIYSASVIRINVTKQPSRPDHSFAVIQSPLKSFHYQQKEDSVEITTKELRLIVDLMPLRFSFYTADGRLLSQDDKRFGTIWNGEKFTNYRKLFQDEKFIGLGEKRGNLDRRGDHYVNWNTDAAFHTPDTDPLYKTFPFFIGLHNGLSYGLFLDNTHRSFFDFGATTNNEMIWLGAEGGDLNYYFFGAQSVRQIIEDYTWLTGRMEMPPLWSLGYQQCRWSYMSADEILEIAKTFRERNIPADAIYCDIDYMDNYKIFTWDKERFADPAAMVSQLNAMGFHLVTIVDPGIKVEAGYKQYDEGIEKNYFAKYPNGENYIAEVWPGKCHFPDFYRDEVKDWWGASFEALTQPGVSGFWNDMNEPAAWGQNIPDLVQFGDKPIPSVRNAYGNAMSEGTYNGTKKLLNGKRPFVLTRAAYSGIQRYSAVWTGDNSANDDHMFYGCRLVNSLGLAGLSLIGVDIGGFMGSPTPELMVRWNSLGVYTPMFRNHSALNTPRREPWVWGEDYEKIIRKDIELRYKLLPYIYSSFYTSAQTGLPLSRTLAIDYTWDDDVYDVSFHNQFLFGDNLLVAPAGSTADVQEVYLPEGDWYRFTTDEHYSGKQIVKVSAPLNDLPVFVKGGAIVPMQNLIQHTAEAGDGILNVHLWYGENRSEFIYYEDDGISYQHLKGDYYLCKIELDPAKRLLKFNKPEGTYKSRFKEFNIIFHNFNLDINNFELNGSLIPNMGTNSVSLLNTHEEISLRY